MSHAHHRRAVVTVSLGLVGGGNASVTALVQALRHDDEAVRRAAAESLGELGAEATAAVGALRQAMRDRDESVRRKVSVALEKIKVETRAAILRAA